MVDKTTTSRSSFDKAFDVSNNSHLANFPYLPMKISTELRSGAHRSDLVWSYGKEREDVLKKENELIIWSLKL